MSTFEKRFEGKNNAGLRAKIREAVRGHETGEERATAVLSLAGTVALTASGLLTLTQVAGDYRAT